MTEVDILKDLPSPAKAALGVAVAIIALVVFGAVVGFIVKALIAAVIVTAVAVGGYVAARRFGLL